MKTWILIGSLVTASCQAPSAALEQDGLPAPESFDLVEPGNPEALPCSVQLPAAFAPDQYRPVVVLLGQPSIDPAADRAQCEALARAIAQRGMVVAWAPTWFIPCCGVSWHWRPFGIAVAHPALAQLPGRLRARFRIAQGGIHLVGVGDAAACALGLALQKPWEFQTLSLFDSDGCYGPDAAPLRGRRIVIFGEAGAALWRPPELARPLAFLERSGLDETSGPTIVQRDALPGPFAEALPAHLVALHAERELAGAAGGVARALDDFHDAASKGDADRYFAMLPDDAVFLGTDATERWTGAAFRAFALPYFQRPSAWTYVPVARHVDVAADGALAWFDEVLDSESYGECRGSGVLQRRGARWVLRQYNLTIPVPNLLAAALVARIRAFAFGREPPTETIVLVRHAEKASGDDPDLSAAGVARAGRLAAMLGELPIAAVFATQYRRTQATVAPFCAQHRLEPKIVPAADTAGLVRAIHEHGQYAAVLVAAHSDTIPSILQQLGVAGEVAIGDGQYDDLFVVTRTVDGTRVLRLHY